MRNASDDLSESPDQLEHRLAGVILPRGHILTAYSGGVDSTLVAAVARRTLERDNAPAVIGDSASLPRRELEEARAIARQLDLNLIEINPGEQGDAEYRANAPDRCYHCKSHLYDSVHKLAAEMRIPWIANGTNADDLSDHRPGLRAASESNVISPLLEAGMNKQQVRLLARHLNLPNADKPAAACLASRIPYGTSVTPERLSAIERAEDSLHELGFTGFRVRHHETVARIELPPDQWDKMLDATTRASVLEQLRAIGYTHITLDLAGFRSGSGNLMLK